MKNFLLFIFYLFVSGAAFGQTTILLEDFEDGTILYTSSITENTSGQTDYWVRTNGTSPSINADFSNVQGSSFFGAQDFDGLTGSTLVETLTFSNINISGFTGLGFSFFVAEDDDGSNQDWDGNSQLKVEYSIDGGSVVEIFRIEAEGGTNTEPKEDTNFDGLGDGTAITDAFQQFMANISGTGSSLDLIITISNLDAGDEDIAIDDVKITGTSSGPTVGFTATTSTETETNATFTATIPVAMSNYGGSNVEVTATVTGGSLAGNYSSYSDVLTFSSNGSQNIEIDIDPDPNYADETIEITIAETTSPSTSAVVAPSVHTITVIDDDIQGAYTLGAISGNTTEAGGTATFTVVLDNQPATDVVLDVTSGDLTENTVSPATLTFTNGNWNVAQIVTVTGVDDALIDGNQTTTITVAVDNAASANNYGGLSETIDVINEDNEVNPLVINEVLADPDGTTGDANGDGTVQTSEDEFVELMNTGATSLDISGYTLSDALQVRHTFPANTIIPAGEPITIFGGGTPTGIAGIVQVASTGAGTLAMNNGGDDVIIKDGVGIIVVSFSYGSEGGDNQSLARNPDFTGAFVKHSTIVSNNVDFSPGSLNEGTGGLPIELLHFSAVAKNQTIHLTWSTASEINNAYFDVQRSTDGRDFETIGTVEGVGTTNNVQEYSFIDERPVNGFNYYRLHQVDFDGKFENSNIVTAKVSHSNDDIFLTPNPTSNVILIQTKTPFERDADFQILNMQGQVVLSSVLQEGAANLEVNIADFPVGIYYLQLFVDNDVMMKKVIKH